MRTYGAVCNSTLAYDASADNPKMTDFVVGRRPSPGRTAVSSLIAKAGNNCILIGRYRPGAVVPPLSAKADVRPVPPSNIAGRFCLRDGRLQNPPGARLHP